MVIMAVIVFVFVVLTGLLFVLGLLVLMVVVEDSLEEALLLVDRFLGGWFCECFVSARAATDFPVRMSQDVIRSLSGMNMECFRNVFGRCHGVGGLEVLFELRCGVLAVYILESRAKPWNLSIRWHHWKQFPDAQWDLIRAALLS